MYLKDLSLVNFKNYDSLDLELNQKLNCFVGDNGEGKTNILDAIYYLCFCKSFLNSVDRQNIKLNQDFFICQGSFVKNNVVQKVYCGVKKTAKKVFKRNKKEYEKLSDHIGTYPLVIIAPSDRDLILEGSDLRRKFLDGISSQFDKAYLQTLIQYNKVLNQRNALLKFFAKERTYQAEQLEVWDEQLVSLGLELYAKRKKLAEELKPVFQKNYQWISGGMEEVELNYQSHLDKQDFKSLLQQNIQKDIHRQFTTVGPHKDDLELLINGMPIKKFGSQGQQKSFLIALKLAQLEFLKQIMGQNPILLLDDVFDKLDEKRVKHLLSLVNSNLFGQIFLTDTDLERIKRILQEVEMPHVVYNIHNGEALKILG